MNKKGQEMSVATLVLIVIGIVVLVMLILGFSMGWQNLWAKVNIFGGGSNVETVVQSCNLASSSNSQYSYCQEFKKVTIEGKTRYLNCQAKIVEADVQTKLSCEESTAKNKCDAMANDLKSKASCEALWVNELGGSWNEESGKCGPCIQKA